ncbi:MerR family transcriptional regulator [Paucibacter soli]|uniref:MerR family transcriptional regulator n=1 Tax=Paucibacter soli TaxID=3133433 RepID=UPI00309CDB30
MEYTVGELAKRAGLTVRALHHYEKLGLLLPSGRSEAGYRLYNEADVQRLHRVLALRHSGLALKDIAALLQQENPPLREVLERQIAEVELQLQRQQRLLKALKTVAARAHASEQGEGGLSEHLLTVMSLMRLFEQYFSEQELQALSKRRAAMGEARVRDIELAWHNLIREVQASMDAGVPAASPAVLDLALRWRALAQQFVGEQGQLRAKVQAMYEKEAGLQRETGVTPAMIAYLRQAIASQDEKNP